MRRLSVLFVCLFLSTPSSANSLYVKTAVNFSAIQVIDYSYTSTHPLGSCAAAWQMMTVIVPNVRQGDVLDTRAQMMLSARESGDQAAVGWVLHIAPWTGEMPLNVELPCFSEPWVGEDIGGARPYLIAQAARAWRADRDYPDGVLIMFRIYAQSAAPRGSLVVTSPVLTVLL